MSAHRDLVDAQQALNEAVEALVLHEHWRKDESDEHWELDGAWKEFDEQRRRLDGERPANKQPTSIATSKADLPLAGSTRRKIVEVVTAHWGVYHQGMTVEQLCRRLNGKHQTISPAVNHLMERGWLKDSHDNDMTNQKHPKIRWIPTDLAVEVCRDYSLEVTT